MTVSDFTLYDMLRRCAFVFGERPALIHKGQVQTHAKFLKQVDALAAGLAAAGLNRGERICVLAQNHPAYLELYGACARQGLVVYPINWRLSPEEIARVVERAAPRMLVCDEFSLPQVEDWPQQKKEISLWYHIGGGATAGFSSFETLYANHAEASAAAPPPEVSSQDGLLVISTAAVDVIPRGALLTHSNLLTANSISAQAFALSEEDVNLLALPLFHITGLGTALAVLQVGGANVMMTHFDAAEAVAQIDAHRVSFASSFPPALAALLDAAQEAGSTLPSLKHVVGLEGPEVITRLEQETSARFWIGFGQSETSGFVSLQRASDRSGAAGRPAPFCQIKLVDDAGAEVPLGEPGEILVRGPMVMQGYFAQPEVTAHTFREGWHHTGDLGTFDAQGYLHYAGRKPEKELIKPGGENVYPAEVETVIMELEQVSGVCVFGVPDAQWGEAVCAVVEARGLSAEQVIDHVGSRIARFKRPKTVHFVDKLPREAQGAVDRPAVKALHAS